jgi:predicted SAM-dependent methyltransferase
MQNFIQFGAGQLPLPPPWRNFDLDCDITQPLPMETASTDIVFGEMVCEHITPQQAWNFLCECHRILKPGGLIRIVIPDFCMTWRLKDKDWLRVNQGVTNNDGTLKDQMKSILFGHGHRGLWTSDLLRDVLEAIGFTGTAIHHAGESHRPELVNLEQHWKSVGKQVAWSESGCVEGVR